MRTEPGCQKTLSSTMLASQTQYNLILDYHKKNTTDVEAATVKAQDANKVERAG